MQTIFTVREAEAADLDALVELERKVWGGKGTRVIAYGELKAWYDTRSPFFLVAEHGGVITGYYYAQLNDFAPERADEYTKLDNKTGKIYTSHAHDSDGDSVYGINICSIMRGSGAALHEGARIRMRRLQKKHFFCHSRIPGFAAYLASLDPEVRKHAEGMLDQAALWYAHGSMRLAGGRDWGPWCTPRPALSLPEPDTPDPVLASHVKGIGRGLGLLRVVPGYMDDPASRNHSAFLASE